MNRFADKRQPVLVVYHRPWFINSRGEVRQTDDTTAEKHWKRGKWGNAFYTKEDAEQARDAIKEMLVPRKKPWWKIF